MKKALPKEMPTIAQLEQELARTKYNRRYKKVMRSTVYTLITVAAVAVLVATLWLPVLQIYGSSMTPTLHEGEVVISLKGSSFGSKDIVAFYYNNKILVKRVIAGPGQWINIEKDGRVFVDEKELNEPYVKELSLGECNIELPYQVPDGRYFVMGDHRATSLDSRNRAIGCVSEEQIVGKIVYCVWPFKSFGKVI